MSLPIGTIITYIGLEQNLNSLIDEGWLLCDGSQQSTTDYGALSDVIGPAFGSSGAGYFNLPDLRGMFLRGVDATGAVDPDFKARTSPILGNSTVFGPNPGSRQVQQLLNHQHNWDQNFGQITSDGSALNVQLAQGSPNPGDLGTQPTTNVDGGGSETRPVNMYVYYLIFAGAPGQRKSRR